MTVRIGVERLAPIIETELWPLLEAHRDELTSDKRLMVLAPDVERYSLMEEAGIFFGLLARDGERIVGYSGNLISQHLHYRELCYVHNDVLFLHPDHRTGSLGLRLMRETRREAKARGARLICWHAKPNTSLASILPKLGCRVQDVIYSEEL